MQSACPPPPPIAAQYAAAVKKREFTVTDAVISLVCFGLGLMFTHFVCENIGGLWGGIMWLLFGITGAVYVKCKKISVKPAQVITFAAAVVFCFTPLFCANDFINVLASFFVFLLYFYLGLTLSGAELFGGHFVSDLFRAVFAQPFSCFADGYKSAGTLLKNKRAGKNVLLALAGLIIALPLTIVVLVILMSSDEAFEIIIDGWFNSLPGFDMIYVVEFGFAFLIWAYLFGGLSASNEAMPPRTLDMKKHRFVPSVLGYTAVTPICLFYILYIYIHLTYFISAFLGKLPEDFIYSSYARQGFFELCVIAVINLCVIIALQVFMRRKENDGRTLPLKIYTTAISVFTLFLIASAISKMALYINEMGMTPLRIYTSWFMILLAVIFVLIIVSQFTRLKFWKSAFISFAVMMSVLCFGNIDGMIANYNVTAYETGKLETVDLWVLRDIGEPAIVHLERLTDDENEYIAERAKETITDIENSIKADDSLAYFNIYKI